MGFEANQGLVGQKLGQYQIESILGRGGMGTVYRGTHEKIGRIAAIKVLSDALALNDEFVSRFVNEAKVVNNIRHKSIIDIVEFIEEDNPRRVAYIMELVEGPTLTELLKSRPLNLVEAVNIAIQIASAMKAVHAVGVIHRDLKPDNILIDDSDDLDLTQAGSIRILDFGIAKLTGAENVGHRTATGAIIGTPVYMAPEQASIHEITTACDVFAVGEILYELVTGKRIFTGDNMQILRAKVRGDMPQIAIQATGTSEQDLALAQALEVLVRDCLEYRPESRIDMEAVYDRLKELRESLQPMVRSASMATITPRAVSSEALSASGTGDKPELNSAAFQTNSITASGLLERASSPNFLKWGIIALALSVSIVLTAQWMYDGKTKAPTRVLKAKQQQVKAKDDAVAIPVEMISVQVTSEPLGALLIEPDSRQELGITPMAVEVTSGKTKKLEVRAKGYQTKFVALDGESRSVKLVLNRLVIKKPSRPAANSANNESKKTATPQNRPPVQPKKPVQKQPKKVYKPPAKKPPAPAMKKGEVPKWSDW